MTSDPVLIAYGVNRRIISGRNHWMRIGQAYPHDQGAGLTLILDVVPRDGRIILLEPDAADDRRAMARAASIDARSEKQGARKR